MGPGFHALRLRSHAPDVAGPAGPDGAALPTRSGSSTSGRPPRSTPGVAVGRRCWRPSTARPTSPPCKAASADPEPADGAYGLGTDDDPAFAGMHEASARVVAGTRDLCEAVWTGQTAARGELLRRPAPRDARRRLRVLHLQRRRRRRSSGCSTTASSGSPTSTSTSTTATASSGLLGRPAGAHGLDPRVGPGAVPGHRLARRHRRRRTRRGRPPTSRCRPGSPTPAGCGRSTPSALPLVRAFRPQVLVTQHGCDTHLQDPLAHLALTVDAQREAARGAASAQPRGMRRTLGRARRRRLRDRRRRPAGVDAPDGDRRAPADRP